MAGMVRSRSAKGVQSWAMTEHSRQDNSSTAPPEDAYVLPFREFFRILWRRAWIIALMAVVFAGAAVGISLAQQPVYQSSIQMLIAQESGISETPTNAGGLIDLTATMTVLVSNRTSAEEVIRQEDLQISPDAFIDERLSVSQVEETQVIEITYSDTDPQRAQRVANAFGDVFSERIANLDSGASAITATVVESAVVPGGPVSPNPLRDGLLAAAVGIIIGAGLALLLDLLNDRWRSPEELEQFSGVPVFGIIPRFEAPRGGKVQESKKKGKG